MEDPPDPVGWVEPCDDPVPRGEVLLVDEDSVPLGDTESPIIILSLLMLHFPDCLTDEQDITKISICNFCFVLSRFDCSLNSIALMQRTS